MEKGRWYSASDAPQSSRLFYLLADAPSTAATGAWSSPLARQRVAGSKNATMAPLARPHKDAVLQQEGRGVRDSGPLGSGVDLSAFFTGAEVLPRRGAWPSPNHTTTGLAAGHSGGVGGGYLSVTKRFNPVNLVLGSRLTRLSSTKSGARFLDSGQEAAETCMDRHLLRCSAAGDRLVRAHCAGQS
jgi:hypothetical protein